MYAYVRYIEDEVKAILPVSLIRSFNPKSCEDYDRSTVRKAFWRSKNGDVMNYYDAKVLLLGKCKNDLIVEMASKRMAIPDIIESSTTNDEVVAEMPSKDPKLQRENKKEAQKRQLKELVKKRQTLKDSSESSDEHNDLVPRKKLLLEKEKRKQLEEDNRALRKELDAERKLCRKLQEALLEKRDVSYSTVLTAGTSSGSCLMCYLHYCMHEMLLNYFFQ
ncbi:BEN domain-containing protein 5-like [Ornithodoros turicata]|uniref:BEN domain-containing protein 5-like n=1 Tax=Ornithodoros turicata TaxID=34597 RepID=UPI003138E5D2